jgi:hypothetical protein
VVLGFCHWFTPGRAESRHFSQTGKEYKDMEQDDLIFLGAAVLLGQMVSRTRPDRADIKTAVQTARDLRDEVNQQHEDARAAREPKKS